VNIYVANLPYDVVDEDLRTVFAGYGQVTSAKVITDMYSGKSRGFGFVEIDSQSDGERAVKELNGSDIKGRAMVVNEARPRAARSEGGDRAPRFNNNRY
jgi:RNA recognition motif-containing protein